MGVVVADFSGFFKGIKKNETPPIQITRVSSFVFFGEG